MPNNSLAENTGPNRKNNIAMATECIANSSTPAEHANTTETLTPATSLEILPCTPGTHAQTANTPSSEEVLETWPFPPANKRPYKGTTIHLQGALTQLCRAASEREWNVRKEQTKVKRKYRLATLYKQVANNFERIGDLLEEAADELDEEILGM
jgi:hypothetical protein